MSSLYPPPFPDPAIPNLLSIGRTSMSSAAVRNQQPQLPAAIRSGSAAPVSLR